MLLHLESIRQSPWHKVLSIADYLWVWACLMIIASSLVVCLIGIACELLKQWGMA